MSVSAIFIRFAIFSGFLFAIVAELSTQPELSPPRVSPSFFYFFAFAFRIKLTPNFFGVNQKKEEKREKRKEL